MLGDKVSIDIVNLATMKLRLAKMGTQKCLVIVAGHETDFLAVDLVRDFQPQRVRDFADLQFRHFAERC